MPVQVKNLQTMLESAHKGFAYQLLALEIQIQSSKEQKSETLIQNLSKLIQFYMLGVEVLESHWDNRYKYFNDKIQGLMKKKHIIQELHMASTGHRVVPHGALVQANKEMRQTRKNEHEINIFFNSDQCDIKKVKEIVKKQQAKLQAFQSKLKLTLEAQEGRLNERVMRRKMKSECYSSRKFDLGSNPPEQKVNDNEDIFGQSKNGIGHVNYINKNNRRASTEKKKNQIKV